MSCDQARNTITAIYNLSEIDDCITKLVSKDLRDDFKQELFLILLSIPCEKINSMNGEIKYYVVRIILNLVRQKRNIFHKKYLDKTVEYNTDKLNYQTSSPADVDVMSSRAEREAEEENHINRLARIDIELGNQSYPYHAEIVKLVARFGSLREVSRQTGIPHVTVHRTLKRVRNQLNK
jgi:DNA-directed RNA polymerase specialized sigma24 family protein